MQCPSCQVQMIKGKKFWVCEDCSHRVEIPPNASFPKKHIFLSYGHDRNEALIHRIKADLETLGHDVWIDRSEIKFGDDWRSAITDGITGSDWMFSFLSKHSTREPGVCLDELAIALGAKSGIVQTILVESETEVVPPVSVSHIQWLDMHDWARRQEADTEGFEAWYQQKFQDIARVIGSEKNIRFAGEIQYLKDMLKPVTMDAFTAGLLKHGFVGRQWLVEEIRQWLQTKKGERAFVLTGEPGIGKSAFSAWLAHYNKAEILAAVFIRYNQPSSSEPGRVVRSLAFQIATRLPDYRKLLMGLPELDALETKNADELFTYLLTEPLKCCIDGGRNSGLILLDALDESQQKGAAGVADLLARHAVELPSWVRIITTTRPEPEIMSTLAHLRPRKLDADDARNRLDIADFLQIELVEFAVSKETIEAIVAKSEGIFLYARYVCEEIKASRLFLERLNEFPNGLGGIYNQFFKRQFPDMNSYAKETAPALQALLAAVEPLLRADLEGVMEWGDSESHRFLLSLGSLFTTTNEKIEPFHRSLADWLTRRDEAGVYYVSLRDGHKRLAVTGWGYAEPLLTRKELNPVMNYCTTYAGVHLYAAGMEGKLKELVYGSAVMIGKGASEYNEILKNLLDWVVKKETFEKEKFLKKIIGELTTEVYSHDLGVLFTKKASDYQRTGATLWALFLDETSLKIRETLIVREPERTDFQRDLSFSYSQVGRIYKALGERHRALEFFIKGLKIMETLIEREPERTDFLLGLSVSYDNIGGIYRALGEDRRALEFFNKGLKIMKTLVEREPERTDFLWNLGAMYNKLGGICKPYGERNRALEFYMKGFKIMETLVEREPERTDFQRDLSVSYSKVGPYGEGNRALEFCMKGLKIMETLIEREPERTDFQRDLGTMYNKLGPIVGERSRALEFYMNGLKIREGLVEREPERMDFQSDLLLSYDIIGGIYKIRGESSRALVFHMKGLKIRETLVELKPEQTDFQRDLSVSYSQVGDIYKALGESSRALEFYMKGIKMMETFVEHEPEQINFQRNIGGIYDDVGGIYKVRGESSRALEFYMNGLKIRETLVEREPERTDFQSDLLSSYDDVGGIYEALGEGRHALELYMKALKIMETLVEREPEGPDFQRGFSIFYNRIGGIYEVLGNTTKALEYYEEALAIARKIENPFLISMVLNASAYAHHNIGQLADAWRRYEEALSLGIHETDFSCAVLMGILRMEEGKEEEANGYLTRGIDLCRRALEKTQGLYAPLYKLALALLAFGDLQGSKDTYKQALDACSERGVVNRALKDLNLLERAKPGIKGLEDIKSVLIEVNA